MVAVKKNKTKVICVSGCVGCGKTTVALKLSKLLDFEYVDVKKLIKKHKEVRCGYDRKRKTIEVDVKKLNKILVDLIKSRKGDGVKGLIIDSHLAHYLPKRYVDVCVICKSSDLKKLKKRLVARQYSSLKVAENLETEVFEVCLIDALEYGHKVVLVDTGKKVDYRKVLKAIKKYI